MTCDHPTRVHQKSRRRRSGGRNPGCGCHELNANPLGLPIGSQTYPHRAMIKDGNFAGLAEDTCRHRRLDGRDVLAARLRGIRQPDRRQAGEENAGRPRSRCISAHFGMNELREKQPRASPGRKDVGITQMITATLGAGDTPTMDDVKRAADEYNKIAAVAAKAGIQQGLHNEGFELSEVDGQRTYDILFELLDPALVKFQFQMSTISRGFVAHEYFTKYPGRSSRCTCRTSIWTARHRHPRRQPAATTEDAAKVCRPLGGRAASTGSRPSRRRRSVASRTTSSSRTWISRRKASRS